jgi:hypothetical protein
MKRCSSCGHINNSSFKTCDVCRDYHRKWCQSHKKERALNNLWNNIRLRVGQRKQHPTNKYSHYANVKNLFGSWKEFRDWAKDKYKPGYDIHRVTNNYDKHCIFLPPKEHDEIEQMWKRRIDKRWNSAPIKSRHVKSENSLKL